MITIQNKTYCLYEFKSEELFLNPTEIKEFKNFLNDVWRQYKQEKPKYWRDEILEDDYGLKTSKQPFVVIDEDKIYSKNYVGYIKFKDYEFNLYPKICKNQSKADINKMLLLWLKYSNDIILPKIDTTLNSCNDNFIEILIYLFSKYTSELLSISIFQHYEEINEETNFLKGKLNFNEYIKNVIQGKAHKFHCTYDSFEVNNKFNQIIKYVSKVLLNLDISKNSKEYLSNIIAVLDEVDDVICTIEDCNSVYINRFMGDFEIVLDYCKLFLQNSISFNECGDFNNFAFLLRTEKLFEDFINNFSKEKFEKGAITINTQNVIPLDESKKFYIKPDIIIKKDAKIAKIIDIKYKNISEYKNVSNSDIYQVITYSKKLSCNNLILLYPYFDNNIVNLSLKPIAISLDNDNKVELSFEFVNCCSEELIINDLARILEVNNDNN